MHNSSRSDHSVAVAQPGESISADGGEGERSRRFDALDNRELKARTIRGGAVTMASQAVKFGVTTLSTFVLARLLSPQEYGLVAMVTAVTGFLAIITDGGLSAATVQRETVTHELMSRVFWLNAGLGLAISLVALALAPVLVRVYGEPRLFWITIALAPGFAIGAATAQHQALLRRQMRFKALAAIDLLSMIASVVVGVALALAGYGYWALVGMQLATPLVSGAVTVIAQPWRPGILRKGKGEGSIIRFGAFLTGGNVMNYLFRNFDNMLIGWRWGAASLGLYTKAYSLLMLPISQVSTPISNVAVAALSRVHGDPARQRRYFVAGYSILSSLTIPIIFGSLIFADELVRFLLGAKWVGSVAVFRLLAPAALVGAVLNPLGWLYLSTGRTDRQLACAAVWCALIIGAFLIGLPYGPEGVASAYSGMAVLLALPVCLYGIHGTSVRLADMLTALRYPVLGGLLTGIAFWFLHTNVPSGLPVGVHAIGGCLGFVVVYAFVLLVVFRQWKPYRQMLEHVRPSPVRREAESAA